jgi:raffinose/stachyose/melibiose transport system substrate-binding protein
VVTAPNLGSHGRHFLQGVLGMKRVLIYLLFFATAVSMVGAGSAAEEKVVLTVWTDLSQDWNVNYIEAYRDIHPDVELEVTVMSDYHAQSRIALESGDKPDVWPTAVGTWLDQFIDGGGAMDITEIAEERGFYDVVAEPFWDFTTRDGRVWAVPYGGIYLWQALFANKKFFEDNNIPYPETMDELIEIVPQIKAAGMQAISWGNLDGWPSTLWLGDLVGQLTDVGIVGRLNSGEEKWDESPAMLTAFQTFLKLDRGGAFVTGYDVQNHELAIQAWVTEKAALLYNGTWFYNVAQQSGLDFEVKTIALPSINAESSLQFVQNSPGSCIMINPDTEVLEAAIDYLDYIASPGFFRAWGQGESTLTPSPIVNPEIELPDWLKDEALIKQFELPASDFWTTSFPIPVYEAVMNNIKLMLAGSVTPEEALQNIEQEHVNNR